MLKTKINIDERTTLQQFSKLSPLVLVRQKCYAVLIADQGLKSDTVAEIVGKTKRSVNRWLSDWNQRRLASIFFRPRA